MELILFWIAVAAVTAIAANARGRSAGGWLVLGLLFSLLALVAVLVMRPIDPPSPPGYSADRRDPEPAYGSPSRQPPGYVKSYHGVVIERNTSGFSAQGRQFVTVLAAENYIDEQRHSQTAGASSSDPAQQYSSPPSAANLSPRLMGDGTFSQFVAGASNYQHTLVEFSHAGRKGLVTLSRQPDNPHDRDAVVVTWNARILGYLPREDAADFATDLTELNLTGQRVEAWARVVGGSTDKPTRGLRIDLAWPLERA